MTTALVSTGCIGETRSQAPMGRSVFLRIRPSMQKSLCLSSSAIILKGGVRGCLTPSPHEDDEVQVGLRR